jgi:hypothetical protein
MHRLLWRLSWGTTHCGFKTPRTMYMSPLLFLIPWMQAIASILWVMLAVDDPPEPLWSFVTSWSGPSQSQPHNQADCCPSSDSTATTAPQSVSGASTASANTSGRAPASAGKAGSAGGSEQPQIAYLQQRASAQHMNITSLAFEVTAHLWELLADIVGQAQRPASWMRSSRGDVYDTGCVMLEMMEAYSAAWHNQQDTQPAPSAPLEADSDQAALQRGRQLSALMPPVPWDRLKAAATSIAGAGDQDVAGLLRSMESVWLRAQAT